MFKSTSTSLILLGILAVIVGIVAIAWQSATILALVILFAVYAFMDAGLQAARAFSGRTAGPVIGHLLLALISLAAAVVALVWPGPTAFVLVIVMAAWALVSGVVEIAAGFGSGESAGTRALFIIFGLVSVAFGILLFARPDVGAVTLALLFGLYSLICGFSQIIAGMIGYPLPEIRRLLVSLVQACSPDPESIWSWSRWRRRRQYQARLCHYRHRDYALALTGARRLAGGSRYARRRACGPDRHVWPGVFW